jgi:hypothetical protein
MKANITMKVKSNTDYVATQNQTLNQQKQLNGKIPTYLSILTLNAMDSSPPAKDTI